MTLQAFHRRVIGVKPPFWAWPLRVGLAALSQVYGSIVRRRNAAFDAGERVYRCGAPVISVGNLTVGGTGKTPVVIALARRLAAQGHRPAVLMRGYGADRSGANDEQQLILRHVPGGVCIADADRSYAARQAVERHAADVLILDDGFQHRRLGRDLDLVLIDATCPFGFDRLLPRGLLREPVEGLRRADAVIVTRSDEVDPGARESLKHRLVSLCPGIPIIEARHRAGDVLSLDGHAPDEPLRHRRVFAFAGIGNPHSFLRTLNGMGASVVGTRWLRDHARYDARTVRTLIREANARGADLLVTTEKDAVKLDGFKSMLLKRMRLVRIDIEFLDNGAAVLDELVVRSLGPAPSSASRKAPTAAPGADRP